MTFHVARFAVAGSCELPMDDWASLLSCCDSWLRQAVSCYDSELFIVCLMKRAEVPCERHTLPTRSLAAVSFAHRLRSAQISAAIGISLAFVLLKTKVRTLLQGAAPPRGF